MAKTANTAASVPGRSLLIGVAGFFGVLTAAAAILWIWFGTKVFFEMIAAGVAYCF